MSPRRSLIRRETLPHIIAAALLLNVTYFLILTCIHFSGLGGSYYGKTYIDFDAFHLVSKMIRSGHLQDAYSIPKMVAAEWRDSGTKAEMPWTYPPQFNIVLMPFAYLNKGIAYLLFLGGTFSCYLWLLRRIAGTDFSKIVILMFPAMLICVICGQNGFLTASLAAAFCLASLKGRTVAGLSLGAFAIKPHLAIGLSLWTLLRKRWTIIGYAAATTLATSILATLVFGIGIWSAMINGLGQSAAFLAAGGYPLYRMTSAYAAIRTLGLGSDVAMIAQGFVAVAACSAIAFAALRAPTMRQQLGIAALCTLCMSPYIYDYDMQIMGVALALLAKDLSKSATKVEQGLILVLCWISGGWWYIWTQLATTEHYAANDLTLAGVAFLVAVTLILRILMRTWECAEETPAYRKLQRAEPV